MVVFSFYMVFRPRVRPRWMRPTTVLFDFGSEELIMRIITRRGFAVFLASVFAGLSASGASAQFVIEERVMPTLKMEVVPTAPGGGWSWVPGHWAWNQRAWVWLPGHYVRGVVPPMPAPVAELRPPCPGPGWFWVRGHYVWEGNHWEWRHGHWDS